MPNNRRRQRSVRITIAVALLIVAGIVVFAALMTGEVVALAAAAVTAFLAGVGAVRLVHDDLVKARRDAGEDRAAQARAYQEMDARRTDEQATFATTLSRRLNEALATVSELRGTLRLAERRIDVAEKRAKRETRRREDLQSQVDQLTADTAGPESTAAAEAGTATDTGALAAADGDSEALAFWDSEVPTVVDLLAWDEQPEDEVPEDEPLAPAEEGRAS